MGARSLVSVFILLAGVLSCGLISVYFGKELNWDLANYHYYNPYYFLQQRWKVDYWPSSFVHVHFTPTLDFLTYFLINQVAAKKTMFIMGALHGINFWLLFCIARLFLPQGRGDMVMAAVISVLGLYGPMALPGMGSFQHDNLVSLFVLGFVFLQLKCLLGYAESGQFAYGWFFAGCVLLGLGVGCKLTAGIFVGGALFANGLLFTIPWKQRVNILSLFVLGVGLGLLVTSGYWMLFLWEKYQNPFFPLWNGVFRSPDFPFYNWHDQRFLPRGWVEAVFYPFYFSLDGRTSDTPFRDFRFAIVYVLFLAACCFWVKERVSRGVKKSAPLLLSNEAASCDRAAHPCAARFESKRGALFLTPREDIYIKAKAGVAGAAAASVWLFMFFIFSYGLWEGYFSIMRYIVVLEMLAPLLIYLLLVYLIRDGVVRFAVSVLVFLFMAGMMVPTHMVRAVWYETSYFNVEMPAFVRDIPAATVLVAFPAYAFNTNPRPQAYLIPFFPAGWRFIGIPFIRDEYTVPEGVRSRVKQGETLYLLSSPEYMPKMASIASSLGFGKRERCDAIPSDRQFMTHEDVLLCSVKQ